jgi:hypothetical protein
MLFPDSLFVASLGLTVMVAIFAVGFEIGHYLGRRRVTRTDWNSAIKAKYTSRPGGPGIIFDLERAFSLGHEFGIERAAAIVDQCNREGPYNAIGAASRIRALKVVEAGHYLGRRRVTRTDWNDGYEAGRRSGYLAGKRDNQPRERNGRFTKQEIAP